MVLYTQNGDKLRGTTAAFLQNISKLLWHLAAGVLVFGTPDFRIVVDSTSTNLYLHQFNDDDIHTRYGPYSTFWTPD
jgi:hypothetical protein